MVILLSVTKRRNDWGEYRVLVRKDGKRKPDADYHSDDRNDCIETSFVMAKEYMKQGHTVTIKSIKPHLARGGALFCVQILIVSGSWTLEAGLWKLDSGFQSMSSGSWTLDSG